MKLIQRNNYLEKLIALRGHDIIKVITGIRRCGKSTIFRLFIDFLQKQGVNKDDIFSYNFEDFSSQHYIDNPQILHAEITEAAKSGRTIYVFLDEVQNLKNFERIIDSINLRPNIDVYMTGSNSILLSGEFATFLTGRFVEIHVLPFSIREFVETQEDKTRLDLLFNEYLQNGGMPGSIALPELVKSDYLRGIYNSIMQKDILVRNAWRKVDHFDRVVRFIFDFIGSSVSANSISKLLKNIGFTLSPHTIENYLDSVCDAYLFYKVQRYNIKGKVILSTQEKYYAADIGIKNVVLGKSSTSDMGHALENVVYLELLRRGNQVHIGKADDSEIDFIVQNSKGETEYIQVAWTAKEESTFEREMRPFERVKDYNRRILLTTDIEPSTSYKGIQKINVIDWLTEEN